jgi:predicted DNA binding protein/PAS domain-containing protein
MSNLDGGNDGPPQLGDEVTDVFDRVVGVGVVVLDADLRVAWVNDAFEAFFALSHEDVVGVDERTVLRERVAPAIAEPERFADAVLAAHGDNSYVEEFALRVTAGDGRDWRWLEHWSHPIEDGHYAGGRVELYYDVTDRVECEQERARQRDELARLGHVNSVVRDVNCALVDAHSREDVERAVVERLAAAEPFAFAAFAAFEHGDDGHVPRVWAGLDDPCDLLAATPTAPRSDAVEDGSVTVARLHADAACRAGVHAIACVPVAYRNQVYGVVCAYAGSENALDEREVDVLGELGDNVGHAINAIERRNALLDDRVVEVGLRSRVAAEPFAALGDATTTVVERVIPLPDGQFVQYVEVEGVEPDEFAAAIERVPRYEGARHVGDRDGRNRFEITTTEPPIAGPVADHGGRVERVTIEEGELFVDAVLPRSADVRGVLHALRHEIPDVRLVHRRTRARGRVAAADVNESLDQLTDRQRTVFETAYFAGYFDWPRKSTAEEIADSVGISAPTFHQHLRHALKKLLGTFVEK